MLDSSTEQAVTALGNSVSNVGQAQLMLTIAIIFVGYSMNALLAEVRNLSLITHLMMMQLNYAESSVKFFSKIFDFVTFDLLYSFFPQLDEFNKSVFGGAEPYSEEANKIGYESRYLMTNLGSIPIFIVVAAIFHLIYSLVARFSKSGGKINNLASKKVKSFRWGGMNDLFYEIYLTLSFSVLINVGKLAVNSFAIGINNVLAIISGLAVVAWPIILAVKLINSWKKAPKNENLAEGGEQEQNTTNMMLDVSNENNASM